MQRTLQVMRITDPDHPIIKFELMVRESVHPEVVQQWRTRALLDELLYKFTGIETRTGHQC